LYLDADERLAVDAKEEIRRSLEDADASAYYCVVRSEEHLPRGTVHSVVRYPRLFRRLKGIRFEGRVHEQIAPSIQRAGCTIYSSAIVIEHLGYAQPEEIIKEKCLRNSQQLRVHLKEHPEDCYARFQYGNTLNILGRTDEAMQELRIASKAPNIPGQVRVSVLNALASLSLDDGRFVDALKYATESLKIAPSQVTARWIAATVHTKQHNSVMALAMLEEVVTIQNDSERFMKLSSGTDDDIPFEALYMRIGYCHEQSGLRDEAAQAYFEALKANPDAIPARQRFLENIDAETDSSVAVKQLAWLVQHVGELPEVLHQLARSYQKLGNFAAARMLLERVDSLTPATDGTIALWMDYHLANGDIPKAMELYAHAEQTGISTLEYQKAALRLALHQHNLARAVVHLERMAQGVTRQVVRRSGAANASGL
jgi:tetratricopeptide (TPR) repeat protein